MVVKSAALMMFVRHWQATLNFWRHVGRLPQLCPPSRHNDKFYWRKTFDHNPDFEIFCNKLACKDWVRQRCPDLPIPATLYQRWNFLTLIGFANQIVSDSRLAKEICHVWSHSATR
jgi:hypothetical protein